MTAVTDDDRDWTTTSGSIAVANLNAQIDGLTASLHRPRSPRAAATPLAVAARGRLVDLLILRGQVLGRVADYDQAEEVAEALVRDAPGDGRAWLAQASARATFHRFPEALADLDAAGRRGAQKAVLEVERAAILQAIGCHADALVLRQRAADRRPDITTLGALAVLQAERGEVTVAARLFTEARRRYRGVSPFPVAELDFRRGHMWLREKRLAAAGAWFQAAVDRVPDFAPALGHLAEVEAALGDGDTAIGRLRALAETSDDPKYAAGLARVLTDAGRPLEAQRWRVTAATRYNELMSRHPEAFADHAAKFWLTMGGDPRRWLELAEQNQGNRRAARQRASHHLFGPTA